jgi:hypothetical protein
MMKRVLRWGLSVMTLLLMITACDIEKEPFLENAESEKAILSFKVDSVIGVIDDNSLTVTLTFPQGVDVSHLTPIIEVSTYATIYPESGVAQDFTNPVTYTVTAFDGTTVDYQVFAVIIDPENEKSILSFRIENPGCEGVINEMDKTILLSFPVGTDITQLVPIIEVSEGAMVEPASGVVQDFTNPVIYTVTALNGSTTEYTVTALLMDEPWLATGKTVLIKDFTGVRCVNCPEAADYAHMLQHQLGEDRVFILSVHAGFLAMPIGGYPDFRTEEGTIWYNNNSSNPLFSVDHVALTEGNTLYVEQIDTPVNDALNEEQTFEIRINVNYDNSTRSLSANTKAYAISDLSEDCYVTVCLFEDHVIGKQTVPGGSDDEYDFRNVFRGTLNGAGGAPFGNGPVVAGTEDEFNYTVNLDSDYNEDQCYILSYVYRASDGKILQTAIRKIK